MLKVLKEYYKDNSDKIKRSGYFFINRNGSRFSEQSIRIMMKKYTWDIIILTKLCSFAVKKFSEISRN